MIPKFQQGGFMQFFSKWQPGQNPQSETPKVQQTSQPQSKSEKESNNGKLTEKDLFTLLKDLDGLPNEMKELVSELQHSLYFDADGHLDVSTIASSYLNSLYSLKTAQYNKDLFNKSKEKALSAGYINEAAITESGNIIVQDKEGKFHEVSPEKWTNLKGRGYSLVTNNNLLWMRSHAQQYVGNNNLLQIVDNGVSLDQVHKMIKDRFNQIGKSETSQDMYVPKEVIKGAEKLDELIRTIGLGPEGYYKISQTLSQTDTRALTATLKYIYNTLPTNAKARLAIETDDGSQSSVIELIQNSLLGIVDTKSKLSADYEGAYNPDGTKVTSPKDPKDTTISGFWQQVMDRMGGTESNFNIFIDKAGSSVLGKFYGTTPGLTNDCSLTEYINKSGIGHLITNPKNITFGNVQLSSESFNDVMVNSSQGMYRVILPTKDGKVWLEAAELYSEFKEELRQSQLKEDSQEYKNKVQEILNQPGFEILKDLIQNNGELTPSNSGLFIVFTGLASDKTKGVKNNENVSFDNFKTSNYIVQASQDFEDTLTKALSSKDNSYEIDKKNWYEFFDDYDHLYKGNIYIPISNNKLNAKNADSNNVSESSARQYETLMQEFQKRQIQGNINSDTLGIE